MRGCKAIRGRTNLSNDGRFYVRLSGSNVSRANGYVNTRATGQTTWNYVRLVQKEDAHARPYVAIDVFDFWGTTQNGHAIPYGIASDCRGSSQFTTSNFDLRGYMTISHSIFCHSILLLMLYF